MLRLGLVLATVLSANAFVVTPTLRIQSRAAAAAAAVAPCGKFRFANRFSVPTMSAASLAIPANNGKAAPKIMDRLKSVLVVFVVGFAMMLGAPAEADAASKGRSGGRAGGSGFKKPSQDYSRGVGRTTPSATTPAGVASPSAATTGAVAAGATVGAVGATTVVHHHHSPGMFGGWHSPFHSPFGYGFGYGFRPMIILPSFFFVISIGFLLFWLFVSR